MNTATSPDSNLQDSSAGEYVQGPASLPLYLAGLIVTVCGLFAVHLILGDGAFGNLTIALATIGWLVSFVSRRNNVSPRAIEMPAAILCVCLAIMAFVSDQVLPFLSPPGIADDRAKSLAVLLDWLVVFRSFTLITDGSLLFCCVPTIAMIGLAGTMTAESALVTDFIVFASTAAFMLVHENFLRTRRTQPAQRTQRAERALFANQLQVAGVCAIGSLILANAVVEPMRVVGSHIVLNPAIMAQAAKAAQSSPVPVVEVTEQQELSLGGTPPKNSNQVVMHVKADNGSYWRGTTFNEYTGRTWKNSDSRSAVRQPDSTGREVDDLLADSSGTSAQFTYHLRPIGEPRISAVSNPLVQHFTLSGASNFRELYAAPECRILQIAEPAIRLDAVGCIHLTRPIQGIQYTVESEVADRSPDRLKAASGPYPAAIRDGYLNRDQPTAAMQRIREAADAATRGLKTNYEKVEALKHWVERQCKYNLDVSPVPFNENDVVSYFLFTAKQGYCTEFASALALLCRASGIPARVASGFLPGTLDRDSQEYYVRERDKHAWTEVYFPGVGWAPFDATTDADDITPADSDRKDKSNSLMGFFFRRGWLPPTIALIIVAMLAYVLKVELFDRIKKQRPVVNPLGLPSTNMAIVMAYVSTCKSLARRGLQRPAHATPLEYLEIARARLASAQAFTALEALTDLQVRYRYGRLTADESDVSEAQRLLASLRDAMKSSGRKAFVATELEPAAAGA